MLQEAGIPIKLAATIGIAVDHRRHNRSLESLQVCCMACARGARRECDAANTALRRASHGWDRRTALESVQSGSEWAAHAAPTGVSWCARQIARARMQDRGRHGLQSAAALALLAAVATAASRLGTLLSPGAGTSRRERSEVEQCWKGHS